MNTKPTPRTDLIINLGKDKTISCLCIEFHHLCETLELERDEWAAKAVELSAERESNAMQALAFKAERDEARRLAEQFASGHDVIFYWENVKCPSTQP